MKGAVDPRTQTAKKTPVKESVPFQDPKICFGWRWALKGMYAKINIKASIAFLFLKMLMTCFEVGEIGAKSDLRICVLVLGIVDRHGGTSQF